MHDLFVDRCTQAARISTIAFKGWPGLRSGQLLLNKLLEFQRCDPRANLLPRFIQNPANQLPRAAQFFNFRRRLTDDHVSSSMAFKTLQATTSGLALASTSWSLFLCR